MRNYLKLFRRAGLALAFASMVLPATAETHVCVLRGAGGEARYDERFQQWSDRLGHVLVEQCGISSENMRVLPTDAATPPLTRASVESAMAEIAGNLQEGDTFILLLIGHGSMQIEPKFLVSGPDISGRDFRGWLDALPARRQIVIDTTSASAAFINALSRPERVIVTSTRNSDQPNATEFMEHLLLVLEERRGDRNRDGQVTLAELCDAAAVSTLQWYEREDFIATEGALLDDNGDALGSRLPLEGTTSGDGGLAASIVMESDAQTAHAEDGKREAYRKAIEAVEAWKRGRDTEDQTRYWNTLENLLLEAARLNRDLIAPKTPAPPADTAPDN